MEDTSKSKEYFDEFGFVDKEFFHLTFSEQADRYTKAICDGKAIFRKPEPDVKLIDYPDPQKADYLLAASAEYSAQIKYEESNDYGRQVLNGLAIPAGMEMINFTFLIRGCSRVFTHQQVRHRLASLSQSNSRDRVLPPVFVLPVETPTKEQIGSCLSAYTDYLNYIKIGVEPQDARYFLTDTTVQSMVFSVDFKSLQGLCNQRLCINMQPETSYVAWRMKMEVEKVLGKKFGSFLRPTCDRIKKCLPIQCNVYDGCGKWPTSMASKTGKRPLSQTSQGNWKEIRERFFEER